ncbi:hypothetical protein Tco_1190707 [Tanacetum coccineum]
MVIGVDVLLILVAYMQSNVFLEFLSWDSIKYGQTQVEGMNSFVIRLRLPATLTSGHNFDKWRRWDVPLCSYISVDDLKKFIPPKVEEEPLEADVNDDRHHADEPTAPRQKCSSCSQTQSRKRQRQSSDNKEDGEIGACFEKLEKLGWGEGPMYDTVVLLFGESSDYRKIWLHLKPKSCVNWVKNAGGSGGARILAYRGQNFFLRKQLQKPQLFSSFLVAF